MDQKVRALANAHKAEATLSEEVAQLELLVAISELGQQLTGTQDQLGTARLIKLDAEDKLRHAAPRQHELTGNKQPHAAVKVVFSTFLDYDPSEALEYARQHLPKALRLNKQAFEKAAKAIEPNFVTMGKEPRTRIASDLSAYLGKEEGVKT